MSDLPCRSCGTLLPEVARFCLACGAAVSHLGGLATLPEDAAMMGELERLLREDAAGTFEIDRLIGMGGMGAVFLATEIGLGRRVAVKVLPPERSAGPSSVERFKREARTAATLDHPNIVPIYRISGTGRLCWYAMKYIDGRSLAEMLRENGRLSLPSGLQVLTQVADALDFAHERGVVHRDVKPANVLLDSRSRAYVTDFGIAKARMSAVLTATGAFVGTPSYMPPEQWAGQTLTGAADEYAFAVLAAETVAGCSPFEGDSPMDLMHKHCDQAPDLQPITSEFGAGVSGAFARALAKHPADRFPTVGEFVTALKAAFAAAAGATAVQFGPTAVPPPSAVVAPTVPVVRRGARGPVVQPPSFAAISRPERRWWRGSAVALAVLVVVGAVAYSGWFLTRGAAAPRNVAPAWSSPPATGRNPTGGVSHTCLLTQAGGALCWGTGSHGQIGDGRTPRSYVPVAVTAGVRFVQLDAGDSHTCGVSAEGGVLCWGLNDRGQSGPSSGESCISSGLAFLCNSRPSPIPGVPPVRQVSAGADFTCGLGTDGLAYCWGSNMRGQSGRASGADGGIAPVGGRGRLAFTDLAAGQFHACGLARSGAVFCWGWNLYGQLGTRAAMARCTTGEACSPIPLPVGGGLAFIAVAAGSGHTCALAGSGFAYCWGHNAHGQVGSGASDPQVGMPATVAGDHRFTAITSGWAFTCALTSSGEVWCWGDNSLGQLGVGSSVMPESKVPVRVPIEGRVVSIGAGARHACATLEGDRVVCWGSNGAGQLGDGYVAESETVVRVRADAEGGSTRR